MPPYRFTIWFKEGGIGAPCHSALLPVPPAICQEPLEHFVFVAGTFCPLYFRFIEYIRWSMAHMQQQQDDAHEQDSQKQWQTAATAPPPPDSLLATAFVDPGDPTVIYLSTPPAVEAQRLDQQAPKYASNYGADEKYEPADGIAS